MPQQWIHGFSPRFCWGSRIVRFTGFGGYQNRGAVQRSGGRLRGCQGSQIRVGAGYLGRFSQRSFAVLCPQLLPQRGCFEKGGEDQCQRHCGSSFSAGRIGLGFGMGCRVCRDGGGHGGGLDCRVRWRKTRSRLSRASRRWSSCCQRFGRRRSGGSFVVSHRRARTATTGSSTFSYEINSGGADRPAAQGHASFDVVCRSSRSSKSGWGHFGQVEVLSLPSVWQNKPSRLLQKLRTQQLRMPSQSWGRVQQTRRS